MKRLKNNLDAKFCVKVPSVLKTASLGLFASNENINKDTIKHILKSMTFQIVVIYDLELFRRNQDQNESNIRMGIAMVYFGEILLKSFT